MKKNIFHLTKTPSEKDIFDSMKTGVQKKFYAIGRYDSHPQTWYPTITSIEKAPKSNKLIVGFRFTIDDITQIIFGKLGKRKYLNLKASISIDKKEGVVMI